MRVYSRGQVHCSSYLPQERDHRLPVAVAQSLPYLIFQSGDDLVDPRDKGGAGSGQAHVKGAPVLLAAMPSHPARSLHFIDQSHHVVAMDPEGVRQLLLRLTRRTGEVAQDAEGARGDTERSESLREDLGRAGTNLRQQEGEGLGISCRLT